MYPSKAGYPVLIFSLTICFFDIMAQSKIDKNLKALRDCLSTITSLQDQLLNEQYACVNRQNELKQALAKL